MNRRSFLTNALKSLATIAILPSAITYQRHWVRPEGAQLLVPALTADWNDEAIELYNRLPLYLIKMQHKLNPNWDSWNQLVNYKKFEPVAPLSQVFRGLV